VSDLRVGLEQRKNDTGIFYVVTLAIDGAEPRALGCDEALELSNKLRRAAELAEYGTREGRGRPLDG
jgi:hypothetical protein